MDFVFDRVANGRSLKILGIVDDGTHESVAVHPEHAIGGDHLVRILERICASRGYPQIIGSDNAKEFTGQSMLTWAHEHQVKLRLIEPGKPNQNAYVESFNGRFRDGGYPFDDPKLTNTWNGRYSTNRRRCSVFQPIPSLFMQETAVIALVDFSHKDTVPVATNLTQPMCHHFRRFISPD